MTIDAAGWFDWALDYWGPGHKTNGGVNPVKAAVFHSAEGYERIILDLINNGPNSWTGSVMKDGRFLQHYSCLDQVWHGGHPKLNDEMIGIEFEGKVPQDPTLTPAQVDTARRIVQDLEDWKGWTARRPSSLTDTAHTMWEHKERVRLGGKFTECPSGRIPWDAILKAETPHPGPPTSGLNKEGPFMVMYNDSVPVFRWGSTDGKFPGRLSKLFGSQWLWLRNDNGRAYWSPVEGD